MLSFGQIVVGNLCLVCVLTTTYYTALFLKNRSVCRNLLFVLKNNTPNPQPYPQAKYKNNRFVFSLTHITHRTYKNKDYLYKYIITKHGEIL